MFIQRFTNMQMETDYLEPFQEDSQANHDTMIQQSSHDLKLINLENKAYKRWQISSIHADFLKAIQKSRINDELVHGLNKVIKALDRKEVQLNI